MRLIVQVAPGELELNYMWLPTWLGMSAKMKADIEKALQEKAIGKALNAETLDYLHEQVLEVLEEKCPHVVGLRDYLDGIKFVSLAE